jgi:hypothetical protein
VDPEGVVSGHRQFGSGRFLDVSKEDIEIIDERQLMNDGSGELLLSPSGTGMPAEFRETSMSQEEKKAGESAPASPPPASPLENPEVSTHGNTQKKHARDASGIITLPLGTKKEEKTVETAPSSPPPTPPLESREVSTPSNMRKTPERIEPEEQESIQLSFRGSGTMEVPQQQESDLSVLSMPTTTPSPVSVKRQIEETPPYIDHHSASAHAQIQLHQRVENYPASFLHEQSFESFHQTPIVVQGTLPAHAVSIPTPTAPSGYHPAQYHYQTAATPTRPPSSVMMTNNNNYNSGKRKIYLRLVEDVRPPQHRRKSSFLSFRRKSNLNALMTPLGEDMATGLQTQPSVDRGRVTVSWYEGTTSSELHEHVRQSVSRKLDLRGNIKLNDLRVLDDSTNPPEGLCQQIMRH